MEFLLADFLLVEKRVLSDYAITFLSENFKRQKSRAVRTKPRDISVRIIC